MGTGHDTLVGLARLRGALLTVRSLVDPVRTRALLVRVPLRGCARCVSQLQVVVTAILAAPSLPSPR